MAWAAILEADVKTHISGAELASLRAAALADGQADPVQPSINQITGQVRGYVAACVKNTLDTDTTKIPTRLLGWACDMIVAEIISRVPGYDLDDNRQDKFDKAIKALEKVAACKFAIEDPVTGGDPGAGIEIADSETRISTRDSLQGL